MTTHVPPHEVVPATTAGEGQAAPLSLQTLLRTMVHQKASDLHITVNSPPLLRIDGSLVPLKTHALSAVETKQLCYSMLTEAQRAEFEINNELDFSFGLKNFARFRGNLFLQRGAVAGAFRHIPLQIRNLDELGLPAVVRELASRPRGLVLVTGPTGCGKSTTLAAMVDLINRERRGHIVTIEDPIEYIHGHKSCMVNQRQVGEDTKTFKHALKYVLRQDPDVVLIGEMRDLETIEAALTISETGHLTFGTLHTNSAIMAVTRIIDVFPPYQQPQVRTQLSHVLEAVVSQQLLPRVGGGMAVVTEVLVCTAAVRNLIREDKIHQIPTQMQTGRKFGMHTMDQSLAELVLQRQLRADDAMAASTDAEDLRQMILKGRASARGPG